MNMKKILISLLMCTVMSHVFTPKAQAAFKVQSPAGATFLVLGGLAGGTASFIFGVGLGVWGDEPGLVALGVLGMAAGIGLIVLDENDEASIDAFEDFPHYVLQEINYLADQKAEHLSWDEKGMKEVKFTEDEIAPILEMAQGEVSAERIEKFKRELLAD
jgi:hypothetical protein